MDVMDSSDTPQSAMNERSNASVTPKVSDSSALPLSVDEDNARSEPVPAAASHSLFGSSSSSDSIPVVDHDDDINSKPTSQDDVYMPTTQHEASFGDRMSASMSSIKDKLESGLESAQKELKQGAQKMEDKMDSMKADYNNKSHNSSSMSSPSSAEEALGLPQDTTDASDGITDPSLHVHNRTGSSQKNDESLVHPYASNMRDADQHPGLVSLVSHANEHSAVSPVQNTHVSTAQQRGIDAGSLAHDSEPKDDSAVDSNRGAAASVTGGLSSMNAKLEEGIEAIKGKVDEWRHQGNTSSSDSGAPTNKHTTHSVTGTSTDHKIPTLIDQDNAVISEQVRLRQKQGMGNDQ